MPSAVLAAGLGAALLGLLHGWAAGGDRSADVLAAVAIGLIAYCLITPRK